MIQIKKIVQDFLFLIFKQIKLFLTYMIYIISKLKATAKNRYLLYIIIISFSPFLLDYFLEYHFERFLIDRRLLNYIINGYINFISLSIPVALAFSYFIYREQQSVSLRHKVFDLLFNYFVLTIPGLFLAIFIKFKIISIYFNEESINLSDDLFKVFFLIILIFLLIIILPRSINTLLKILSITNQIKLSIDNILINIKLLYNIKKSNIVSAYFFENTHDYLESIFQSFEYSLENKIDKIFSREFNRLSETLLKIMEDTPFCETVIFSQQLIINHRNEFEKLYQSMVNNVGKLIFNLYYSNKELEMRKAIQILKDIEPNKVSNLYPVYFQELESIAIRSLQNNDIIFDKTLSLLEEISESNLWEFEDSNKDESNTSTNAIGVLLIYQSMLKVAIENNDVKRVTSITYSMDRFSSPKHKSEEYIGNESVGKYSEAIQLSIFDSLDKIKVQISTDDILSEITLFILFQGALKSIEIGSYRSTGQLIKRITTDFEGEKINGVFNKFHSSRGELKKAYKDFDNDYTYNDLITNFRFNERSYEYCNQKLLFLLMGQQHFIINEKISFSEFFKGRHEIIPSMYFNLDYLQYIRKKIEQVGSKYGLVYIKDKDFIDELVEFIKNNQ